MWPSSAQEWVQLSEVVKNFGTGLAVLGAVVAYWKWQRERQDRAADILFKLEEKFGHEDLSRGREAVESSVAYEKIKQTLRNHASDVPGTQSSEVDEVLESLDSCLRFYVFLNGVRQAKQVPDAALKACYRYLLCHCRRADRAELWAYVSRFFPTLRAWLEEDAKLGALDKKRYFNPEEFGWKSR